MLKSPLLSAVSMLVTLLSCTSVAKAAEGTIAPDMALSFALPSVEQATKVDTVGINVAASLLNEQISEEQSQSDVAADLPSDEMTGELMRVAEPLPPISDNTASKDIKNSTAIVRFEDATLGTKSIGQDTGVQFLKDTIEMPTQQPIQQKEEQSAERPAATATEEENILSSSPIEADANLRYGSSADDWIFEGGSGSLVAHTVGSAEGTRQWDGGRTWAYYGHKDPGNGVWNLGTFSYQHEATSPEDADEKQIKRLKAQGFELEEQAIQQGMKLTLIEKLNGLDLANQAPLAALGRGGYVEQLAQAHRLQLQGEAAIAWARTQAYMDPDTKLWDAPGLGNNVYSISQDQERRMSAIGKALAAYRQANEASLTLADLRGISPEKSEPEKLEPDEYSSDDLASGNIASDSLTEAFRLSDRPTNPTNAAKSVSQKSAVDTSSLDSAAEINFTLPPPAQTGSGVLAATVPAAVEEVPVNSSDTAQANETQADKIVQTKQGK